MPLRLKVDICELFGGVGRVGGDLIVAEWLLTAGLEAMLEGGEGFKVGRSSPRYVGVRGGLCCGWKFPLPRPPRRPR